MPVANWSPKGSWSVGPVRRPESQASLYLIEATAAAPVEVVHGVVVDVGERAERHDTRGVDDAVDSAC
jgi:hypothetical protein